MTSFFCTYCGGKIMVDDSDRKNISLNKMEHEETMKQLANDRDFREMDHIERIQAEANSQERFRAAQKNKGSFRKGCVTVVLILVAGFIALAALAVYSSSRDRQTPTAYQELKAKNFAAHQEEVERLTGIENEVLDALDQGDYSTALVKANTIHYNVPEYTDTRGITSSWEERREKLISSIYQVSGMESPTPLPVPDQLYMEGATEKTTWPRGAVGRMLPVPASEDISISWEKETGCYVHVKGFSQEQFNTHCDLCWDMGFTLRYERSVKYYQAENAGRYRLTLSYRPDDQEMTVSLKKQ